MQEVSVFFTSLTDLQRVLILFAGLSFFYVIEFVIPLFRFHYHKLRHFGINIVFTLSTLIISFVLAFLLNAATHVTERFHFGLLYIFRLPGWLFFIAGLLLLDLIGAYLVHVAEHAFRWMWRFHLIHHTDMHVDASTANRHHPGESVFRLLFTALAVLVAGAPFWLLIAYQSLSVLLAQCNHANIKLPPKADLLISIVFVSPGMHKVHHHAHQPYTDSNFGNIFSFWDRLFGTYRALPQADIEYGIDTHRATADHSGIVHMFALPFRPLRKKAGSKFSD